MEAKRYDPLKVGAEAEWDRLNPPITTYPIVFEPQHEHTTRGLERWELRHLRRWMGFLLHNMRRLGPDHPFLFDIRLWECGQARVNPADEEQWKWFCSLEPKTRRDLIEFEIMDWNIIRPDKDRRKLHSESRRRRELGLS